VLGPTGNLQGTYKFFSLTTGKKIKRRQLTRYPMPDSIIRKVEQYARVGATPNELDFADRSGILFEWNEEINESPGELVKEDYVPYPSIPAEFPGVDLERDTLMETIEEEFMPHGRPEDAVALNAGYVPPGLAGVERAAVIEAHADEIAHDELDDDDDIIAVADLPVAPLQDALFIDDADNTVADASHDDEASDADSDADSDNDDSNNEDSEDNDDDDDDNDNNDDNCHGADRIAGARRS